MVVRLAYSVAGCLTNEQERPDETTPRPVLRGRLEPVAKELRFFFITSGMTLENATIAPAEAHAVALENAEVQVTARVSEHKKCIRCWHHQADVGSHAEHPEICGRCIENLPGAAGELRQFF